MLSKILKITLRFLLIFVAVTSLASDDLAAETKEKKPIVKPPLPPPKIPPNKVKPGGGLELFQQSCTSNEKSFTALVPIENPVLTANDYPTLFFYIPDRTDAISHGEFTLVSADEKTTIYTGQIAIDSVPGIVGIQLPQTVEYALEENNIYHWYFKLYCQDASLPTYVDTHGWIERVASTPDREKQIEAASPQIWYDSVAKVAVATANSPQNLQLRQQWSNLLEEINLEHLARLPIHQLELTTDKDVQSLQPTTN